jgi:PPOX class probable F420-dependent enzyme
MAELSSGALRLLEGKNFAHVVTLMRDGSPQVSPVWVDHDGRHILINTAEGRQKPRNIRRDPRVALSVIDHEDPYKYLEVRGRVVEVTAEGGWEHICKMSAKYTGNPEYQGNRAETRIIVKILPEHIVARGLD